MALSVQSTTRSIHAAVAPRRATLTSISAPVCGLTRLHISLPGMSSLRATPSTRAVARGALVQAAAVAPAPAVVPSSAQTAKTIVELVGSGTLSTVDGTGFPLGTYVTYVLADDGAPVLRLRSTAVHTKNLQANSGCSLFIHAPLQPVRSVARITLIGNVEEISAEEQVQAKERHAAASQFAVGVDAPSEDDIFMKLNISRTFYVGGLGSECKAEEIDVAMLNAAQPDGLAEFAPDLVAYMNSDRRMDILRITGGAVEDATIDDIADAELLWVDQLGVYIRAIIKAEERVVRANFMHEAIDERDAKSCLTMMAQLAWENERNYQPAPIPSSDSN
mmetsp:Transcript_17711/g.44930  ORF Transcript_17711/g.44930 Transcript_17711/m.44930 type:complete len:334 (-) Transcript_17711:71-1072(-)